MKDWASIKSLIARWVERIDALSLRERGMVFIATAAVLYLLVDTVLLTPVLEAHSEAEEALEDWNSKLATLEQKSRVFAEAGENPLAIRERELEGLRDKLDLQRQKLDERIGTLMHPAKAPQLLRELLQRNGDLKLVRLESSSGAPFELDATIEDRAAYSGFSRFDMTLVLEGSYLATLRYMQALESVPMKLIWDELDFEVLSYPEARITLALHTLGFSEG